MELSDTSRFFAGVLRAGMNIVAAGMSDVGLQREHNEDAYCILPEFDLFIVADGMGGHKAGDVASKMATHAIASFFQATAGEDATWPFHFDPHLSVDENRLITGIKVANKQIFEASARDHAVHGMGTTVVGALYNRGRKKLYVAHVGDSRAYRIRDAQIMQLTRDHSLLNDYLLVMPDMPLEQRNELPKNVITRALGMQDSVVVDIIPAEPRPGDRYILCSDGLSGMMTDEQLRDTVVGAGDDIEKAAKGLIALANANGGEDNVTCVVIAFRAEGVQAVPVDKITGEEDTVVHGALPIMPTLPAERPKDGAKVEVVSVPEAPRVSAVPDEGAAGPTTPAPPPVHEEHADAKKPEPETPGGSGDDRGGGGGGGEAA